MIGELGSLTSSLDLALLHLPVSAAGAIDDDDELAYALSAPDPSVDPICVLVEGAASLCLLIRIQGRYPVVAGFTRDDSSGLVKGAVEASGLVEAGDSLIACNDISLEHLPLEAVAQAVRPPVGGAPRLLRFLRVAPEDMQHKPRQPYAVHGSFFAREFDLLLEREHADEEAVRTLCTRGIPDDKRPVFWRLLLGYLPRDKSRRQSFLQAQRELYLEITNALKVESRLEEGRSLESYSEDAEVLHSIHLDVTRTHPSLQFFIRENSEHPLALTRVLFAYAKYNFGVRYTQGMNEICAVLYFVFATDRDAEWRAHAEADTYFCFVALMSELRDLFLENMDDTRYGLQGRILVLAHVLRRADARLSAHLAAQGLDTSFFGLRWITTLLSREFDLPDTTYVRTPSAVACVRLMCADGSGTASSRSRTCWT